MKTAQLKVGIKGKEAVQVPLQIPENTQDLLTLAKGNEEVVLRCFKRGWAIENQERSGARDTFREATEAGKTKEEIQALCAADVAGYDPTVAAARGGPRARKPVTIKAGPGGKLSMADFRAQLEAAGVKLNFEEAPTA
jgi:hypothetical protein